MFGFILAILIGVAGAQERHYPPPEQLAKWQSLSDNIDYRSWWFLMEDMYFLPKEPWPEEYKLILLRMCEYQMYRWELAKAGKPLPVDPEMEGHGETAGNIHDMVSWQSDPRFIPFQANFGGGRLSAIGLARIGEPAFETVIEAFGKYDPNIYPLVSFDAAQALELMMKDKEGFLYRDSPKRAIARGKLLDMARSEDHFRRAGAVRALRYFPHPEVFTLLEAIHQNDPRIVKGRYTIRIEALKSLQILRSGAGMEVGW